MRIPGVWITSSSQKYEKHTWDLSTSWQWLWRLCFQGYHTVQSGRYLFSWKVLYSEHGASIFLWNAGNNLTTCHILDTSTLKMKATSLSDMFVTTYQTIRCNFNKQENKNNITIFKNKCKHTNQMETVWFMCLLSFFFPFLVLWFSYFVFQKQSHSFVNFLCFNFEGLFSSNCFVLQQLLYEKHLP
jgi:hypothetical protein